MYEIKKGACVKRLYSNLPFTDSPKAYALIDTNALIHNYNILRQKAKGHNPNAVLIATVKADAYGHSAAICVPALLGAGCRYFAVSSIEEALDVRNIINDNNLIDADILILGYTEPKYVKLAIENNITISLISPEYAEKIIEVVPKGKKLKVQVAIDTGMNRIGYLAHSDSDVEETAEAIELLFKNKKLEVCGAFSHFYMSDVEGAEEITHNQNKRFLRVVYRLSKKKITFPMIHICNTAGIIRFTECTLDAVRMGISLYGPSPYEREGENIGFEPVMKLCTRVTHVHKVKAGEAVGYGGIYVADKDILCATLPIGYADGFLRAYSGSYVTIRGKKARIIGRICMDQCMVDVSDIENVSAGDEVVLFGNDRSELRDLAAVAGSIEYECLCALSSRIPRIKL